jgi:membrane-associated protein
MTRPGWRPWAGRARARDVICLAGIVFSGLYSLAMIPLTPSLIASRPVLLELLSGSTSSVVAAGAFAEVQSKLELGVVVAAAIPGMMKFDLLFWWAGVLWGHRIITMLARRSRHAAAFARRAEGHSPRVAGAAVLLSAFLPVPTPLIYAAAGWAGLGLVPFVICDIIGTAAWSACLGLLGLVLGRDGVTAASLVSKYALATIAVLAAAAVLPHAWQLARARLSARAARAAEVAQAAAAQVVPVVQPDRAP